MQTPIAISHVHFCFFYDYLSPLAHTTHTAHTNTIKCVQRCETKENSSFYIHIYTNILFFTSSTTIWIHRIAHSSCTNALHKSPKKKRAKQIFKNCFDNSEVGRKRKKSEERTHWLLRWKKNEKGKCLRWIELYSIVAPYVVSHSALCSVLMILSIFCSDVWCLTITSLFNLTIYLHFCGR